jgi:hypothetical protein
MDANFEYAIEHEYYSITTDIIETEIRERKNSFIDLLTSSADSSDVNST